MQPGRQMLSPTHYSVLCSFRSPCPQSRRLLDVPFRLRAMRSTHLPSSGPPHAPQQRDRFSEDFLMIPKIIATLLILFAFATVSANLASAQGTGFNAGGGGSLNSRNSHGGGLHRRESHGRESHGRGLGIYGFVDGYGYDNDRGFPDWYEISSGYDECPLFRQRVMTRDGWRVRMVPIC
jgi:hypothetical protein